MNELSCLMNSREEESGNQIQFMPISGHVAALQADAVHLHSSDDSSFFGEASFQDDKAISNNVYILEELLEADYIDPETVLARSNH